MMTWNDLYMVLHEKGLEDSNFLHDSVTVYDAAEGEFYPADTIAFEISDDIIDAGHMFISINAEAYNVQGSSERSD